MTKNHNQTSLNHFLIQGNTYITLATMPILLSTMMP